LCWLSSLALAVFSSFQRLLISSRQALRGTTGPVFRTKPRPLLGFCGFTSHGSRAAI
jgi:hypothetical protein